MPTERPSTSGLGAVPTTALSRGPAAFDELAARYLEEYLEKILLATAGLTASEVWARPTPGANGVGHLLGHLAGNLSLWVRRSLGGIPFERDRAREFARDSGPDLAELLEVLRSVVISSCEIIRGGPEASRSVDEVQGYGVDRLGVVMHAVEHMSYHTGQIVLLVKQLRPEGSLEFYPRHAAE